MIDLPDGGLGRSSYMNPVAIRYIASLKPDLIGLEDIVGAMIHVDIQKLKAVEEGNKELAAAYYDVYLWLRVEFLLKSCLLYTSPSPRDRQKSRMPSSA